MASRLTFADATVRYASLHGGRTDLYLTWVFNSRPDGTAPDAVDIEKHLRSREPYLDALKRRIADAPYGWSRPYWVAQKGSILDWVDIHPGETRTWEQCVNAMRDILTGPQVDPGKRAWRLHVFRGIEGAPGTTGPATMFILHSSHTLFTGLAVDSLTNALWGTEPTPFVVDGLPPAAPKEIPRWQGLLREATVPVDVVSYWARCIANQPTIRRGIAAQRATSIGEPSTAAVLAPRSSEDLAIRFVVFDTNVLRRRGVSTVTTALTAVSRALERYSARAFPEEGPQDFAANVVVAVPESTFMGVNRLTYVTVRLHGTAADLVERSKRIGEELRRLRRRVTSPDARNLSAVQSTMPYLLYRNGMRGVRSLAPRERFTNVTSVNVDGRDTDLAGAPLAWYSGSPGGVGSLTHSLCMTATTGVITVFADPAILTDPDYYAESLHEAMREVDAALPRDVAVRS